MNSPGRIFDISRPIGPGVAVWPGDATFSTEWTSRTADGGGANTSAIRLSVHSGTHADAPFHVSDVGARVGALPLEPFLGPAVVAEADGLEPLDREYFEKILIRHPGAERLLLRTRAWQDEVGFPRAYPPMDPASVVLLIEAGVRLIGTDAPSVDPFESSELPAHHALLRSGIAILENLLLDAPPAGEYQLIALPLRLMENDASPVRAVLIAP